MAYREIEPAPALRPWVECFWSRTDEVQQREHRVLPDGCADLVFDLRDGESIVVGTMTRPVVIAPNAASEFLGVRFRPGRAAAFLRLPLAELTDARVSLRDVWKNWDGRIDVPSVEAELLRRLYPDRDRRLDAAVERIIASGGTERVDELARDIGVSRQHLARQFQHHVGVSPKMFARVIRFRSLLDAIDRPEQVDWADVALAHGYYDQSHLISEFRELAGTTPSFHFSNPAP